MKNAEKFEWLRDSVQHFYFHTQYLSPPQIVELYDLIDTMEERWGLFSE